MNRHLLAISLVSALLIPGQSLAAANTDPDWPCVQRKVPELSVAQVWTAGELAPGAGDWKKDDALARLVATISARKTPLEDAQKQIEDYAAGLAPAQAKEKLEQMFQGVFDTLNGERKQVIAGIARYAGKQRDMAADVRKSASEVDRLRRQPDVDQAELAKRSDQLAWETRIFQERVHSLTFVCEVPTIIEQRLYSLSKIIAQAMTKS